MASGDLQRLLDEAAIEKAICDWCSAIDGRDWDRMRSLIADPVFIDYSSNGSLKGLIPAEAWVSRLKILVGFDATLHMVSNFVIALDGDRATCTSYVNAFHFLQDRGRELGAYACGVYVHELERAGDFWKIAGATFKLAGRYSGNEAFQQAFERARELAPGRTADGPPAAETTAKP